MCYIKSIPQFLASPVAPPVSATENCRDRRAESWRGRGAPHVRPSLGSSGRRGHKIFLFWNDRRPSRLDAASRGPKIDREGSGPTNIWSPLARSRTSEATSPAHTDFSSPPFPPPPVGSSSGLPCRRADEPTLVAPTAPPRCRCRQRPRRPLRGRRSPIPSPRSSREARGSGGWSRWDG